MSLRPTWKGTLKLSLINIPIRVFAATTPGSDVSFHMVHRKCHTRIEMRRWCAHCRRAVEREEVIKGYENEAGRFVLVNEEEIAALRPEATRVVDISDVVDASEVDPILIERAYYLAPGSQADGTAFAVVRDALDGRAAVGRLALHGREYLVAVVARENTLMLYTLRTQGEVRSAESIDELAFARVKTKPQEVRLARQVLESLETNADLRSFTDHYEEALREMLAKKPTTAVEIGEAEHGAPKKVVNLMDALRESLAQTRTAPATTRSSGGTRRPARVLRHPSAPAKHRAG